MRFDTGVANDAGNDHSSCSASIPRMQSESTDAACECSSPFVLLSSDTLNSSVFYCIVFIVFEGLNMTFHLFSSAFSLLLA